MRITKSILFLLLGVAFCLSANVRAQHNPNGQIMVASWRTRISCCFVTRWCRPNCG